MNNTAIVYTTDKLNVIFDMIEDMTFEPTFNNDQLLSLVYNVNLSAFLNSPYYDYLNELLDMAKRYIFECNLYRASDSLEELYNALMSIDC